MNRHGRCSLHFPAMLGDQVANDDELAVFLPAPRLPQSFVLASQPESLFLYLSPSLLPLALVVTFRSTTQCRRHCTPTCSIHRLQHLQLPSLVPPSSTHSRKTRSLRPTRKRKLPMVPDAARRHKGELTLNPMQPLSASNLPSSAPSRLCKSRNRDQTPSPIQSLLLLLLLPLLRLSLLLRSSSNGANPSSKISMWSTSTTSFRRSKRPA
jgi:hypothetical protein